MKAINGKVLYTPKGAALEYGRVGANFYTGCPHECEYCYLKRGITGKVLGGTEVQLKKCFYDKQHAMRVLNSEMAKHEEMCQRYGIFLSFTTDPMIEETRELTAYTIIQARGSGIPVWVLTKCATFIYDENFMSTMECINPAVRKYIHFGFTLTGCDDMEPNASTNEERIKAMRRLHQMGFSTWASIEPVIEWKHSLYVIDISLDCCDHYKVGLRSGVKKDYYNEDISKGCICGLVGMISSAHRTVYLKESTRKLLRRCYGDEEYERIMERTVDMDGKPYHSDL